MTGTRIFSRFSLASIVGLGFGVIWIVFATWFVIAFSMVLAGNNISKYPQVESDGRILITMYDQRTQQRSAVDIDGNEVPNPDSISQASNLTLAPPNRNNNSGIRLGSRTYSFSDQQTPRTFWYFILEPSSTDETTGYFVGYNSLTRERLGFLARQGFTQSKPTTADRFTVSQAEFEKQAGLFTSGYTFPSSSIPNNTTSYQQGMAFPPWVVYLWSKPALLKIDLRQRSVEEVFKSNKALYATHFYKQISVQKVEGAKSDEATKTESAALPPVVQKLMIAFQEEERVTMFDPQNRETSEFIIPEILREKKETFTVYQTTNGYVAVFHHLTRGWAVESYYEAFRFDRFGFITERHEKIAVTPPVEWGVAEQIGLAYAFVLPAPLFIGLFAFILIPLSMPTMQDVSFFAALLETLSYLWLGLLLLLGVSVYLAYLTLKRERRYQSEYALVSVVFVFLFGWFGYIGYRLHRRWPSEKDVSPAEPNGTEIMRPASQADNADTPSLAATV